MKALYIFAGASFVFIEHCRSSLDLTATCVASSVALYDSNSPVVELTASNFQSKVIGSDDVWIVEFYAPWCGHCKSFAPEYAKAAKALKVRNRKIREERLNVSPQGIVNIGAVDMTQHQSVGGPYNVQGFPTVKIFGANKAKPSDFNGANSCLLS